MSKPTIAIDVDEVLFPMAPTFLEYHNSEYGTDFKLDEMTTYYIEELTGETQEQMLAKIHAYLDTQHYSQGKPIAGSIEALRKLHTRYRLIVITARDAAYRGSTERFIDEHFQGLFDKVLYTHTLEHPEATRPKYEICLEEGAIALIDDSHSHVQRCVDNGMTGILFGNYPWNDYREVSDDVIRLRDWPAVLEYFEAK